jgi:hypothetical protein
MKSLIRKILKENFDPENFDWIQQNVKQFTPVEEFLYDLMSSLRIVESEKSKKWMAYKNESGRILMVDNINTGNKKPVLYISYDEIWHKLTHNYGLEREEVEALCVRMLEATHKRKVLKVTENFSLNSWY